MKLIVGKTAVKQCKYYVTLTQKAFALLLTKTCKQRLSLEGLTDFERLRSVKLTDAVESILLKYQPNKFCRAKGHLDQIKCAKNGI